MSIASEITRISNAKAALKTAIEDSFGTTVPSSAKLDDYPEYMTIPPTTFTLEQTSSPLFTVNYPRAIEKYVDNMGGYLFYVKNGTVYAAKLSPSDWNYFSDGTTVTSTIRANTETMIHIPQCYFKVVGKTMNFGGLYQVDGGHSFDSPHWVGAYSMCTGGHSRPNVSGSLVSTTMTEFWNLAQAIHPDFGLANYQFRCLITAVYMAKFGNLNADNVLTNGNSPYAGNTDTWIYYRDIPHGKTDTLADGSGCVAVTDGYGYTRYVNRMCGFEDLYAKIWEFCPGIRFYYSGGTKYGVVYSGNIVSNTATGRTIIDNFTKDGNEHWITGLTLGDYWDVIPSAAGQSTAYSTAGSSQYYCDIGVDNTSGQIFLAGAHSWAGNRTGWFTSALVDTFTLTGWGVGARLAFYAEPTIVTGAELVALM